MRSFLALNGTASEKSDKRKKLQKERSCSEATAIQDIWRSALRRGDMEANADRQQVRQKTKVKGKPQKNAR